MAFVGSHLWQVRQKWGHGLLLYPGIAAIIENEAGQVLLGLRTDVNEWCHFGGGGEPLQSAQETLARELQEELGITPTVYKAFGILSDPAVSRTVFPNQDDLHYWDVNFVVTGWEGEIHPADDEHSEVRFFDVQDLPKNLFKDTPVVLDMLKRWKENGEFQLG